MSDQNSYLQAAYQMNLHKKDQYAFPQHQTQPFYQDMSYGTCVVNPQQPLDDYYTLYGPEYADFLYPGMVHDEFGDMEEISTRPRLTKEQVEVLESQFQANHKPNSQVKRQLAIQTKLTLRRVAVGRHFCDTCSPQTNLSSAELVPKSPGQGQATKEARRIRSPEWRFCTIRA